MTFKELDTFIEANCYDCYGMLDRGYMTTIIGMYGKNLAPAERMAIYGQLVYNPKKDIRLDPKHHRLRNPFHV